MNDVRQTGARDDAASQWHEDARHLVQAHGADPDCLIGYAHTLEQLRFAHADTHAALARIGARPPDGHAHPLPMNAGWHEPRPSSYRPFPPSATARRDPFFSTPGSFPLPFQTGLPQTGNHPRSEADLANWTSGQVNRLPEWAEDGRSQQTPAEIIAGHNEWIRHHADAAAARRLAGLDFPAPAQSLPSAGPGGSGAGRASRRDPRTGRRRRSC